MASLYVNKTGIFFLSYYWMDGVDPYVYSTLNWMNDTDFLTAISASFENDTLGCLESVEWVVLLLIGLFLGGEGVYKDNEGELLYGMFYELRGEEINPREDLFFIADCNWGVIPAEWSIYEDINADEGEGEECNKDYWDELRWTSGFDKLDWLSGLDELDWLIGLEELDWLRELNIFCGV